MVPTYKPCSIMLSPFGPLPIAVRYNGLLQGQAAYHSAVEMPRDTIKKLIRGQV